MGGELGAVGGLMYFLVNMILSASNLCSLVLKALIFCAQCSCFVVD